MCCEPGSSVAGCQVQACVVATRSEGALCLWVRLLRSTALTILWSLVSTVGWFAAAAGLSGCSVLLLGPALRNQQSTVVVAGARDVHILGCTGQLQVPVWWQGLVPDTHIVVGARTGSKVQG